MMLRRRALPAAAALCALATACDAGPRAARAAPSPPPVVERWSAPLTAPVLSDALGSSDAHTLAAAAVDGAGTLHAVFASDRDRDGWGDALAYARLDSAGWSAPDPLAANPALAEAPQVAVEEDGTVHVVWYEHTGTASRSHVPTELLHRALAGGRWSAPAVLYREPLSAGIPDLSLAAGAGPDGVEVLFRAQGRGLGRLKLRGGRAGAVEFLDQDGRMIILAAAPGEALEVAYVGEALSPQRRSAENDLFVRRLEPGGASPRVEVHSLPGRYSYFPRLLVDARGMRHLLWLEDTNAHVFPEALFLATSRDGERWSTPQDVTPPELRGGVFFRAGAVPRADGSILVIARQTRGQAHPEGLYAFTVRDGVASSLVTLAAPGELGAGDAQLVRDERGGRVIALWRGADGVYRSAVHPG